MNRKEYHDRAIATESDVCDADKTWIPVNHIAAVLQAGRGLDLVKRHAFYAKKPEFARAVANENELAMLGPVLEQVQNMSITALGAPRMLHALLGLTTEVGELWERILQTIAEGGQLTPEFFDNLHEELGDLEWYQNLMRDWAEDVEGRGRFTQEDIQAANVGKLEQRYSGTKVTGDERDYTTEKLMADLARTVVTEDHVEVVKRISNAIAFGWSFKCVGDMFIGTSPTGASTSQAPAVTPAVLDLWGIS